MASKINWDEAYIWFMEDARRSYSDVARRFKVTKQSVERHARMIMDDKSIITWAKRRQMLGESIRKQSEDEYRKSAPARTEQHLMQYRNLQIILSTKIASIAHNNQVNLVDANQLASLARALKVAIDGERVILGLSVSVSALKPESEDSGKGWAELLSLAMKTQEQSNKF